MYVCVLSMFPPWSLSPRLLMLSRVSACCQIFLSCLGFTSGLLSTAESHAVLCCADTVHFYTFWTLYYLTLHYFLHSHKCMTNTLTLYRSMNHSQCGWDNKTAGSSKVLTIKEKCGITLCKSTIWSSRWLEDADSMVWLFCCGLQFHLSPSTVSRKQ